MDRSFGSHSDHFREAGLREDYVAPKLTVAVDPATVWPPNNKMRTVQVSVEATDETSDVAVRLVDIQVEGPARADAQRVSGTSVAVRAVNGARYTVVYEATDAAGDTTTADATVEARR